MFTSIRKKKLLSNIEKKSGLDKETLIMKLEAAKKIGINNNLYYYLNGWNLTTAELKKTKKRCDNFTKKHKATARVISITHHVKYEKIVATYVRLHPLGITSFGFFVKKHYALSNDQIDEFEEVLKELKKKEQEDNDFYISMVMNKTGWNKEKVINSMEEARLNGIPYKKYVQRGVYRYTNHWKETLKEELKTSKKKTIKNTVNYIKKIRKNTHWPLARIELEFDKAKLRCSCSWEDYYLFKLYNVDLNELDKYETLGKFEKMRMKYNEHFTAIKLLDNKAKFNEIFSKDIDRKWFINTELKDFADFKKKCKGFNALFAKRIASTMGKGIQKFTIPKDDKELKELYNTIISLPKSIVEDYIVQHPDVMAFCDTSVNTVRITTLNYNGKCKFLYAVFRMGQGSVVDNFHSGGICAYIDVKSGTVITDAADLDGNIYKVNPYSNKEIKGFKIPNWKILINKCKQIYDKVPEVNLIGWDFAITKDGVELIEGNPGASYVIAQVPAANAGFGIAKDTSTPYL